MCWCCCCCYCHHAQARQKSFYELTAKSADVPRPDVKVELAAGGMVRQGGKVMRLTGMTYHLPAAAEAGPDSGGSSSQGGSQGGGEGEGRTIISDFTYDFNPGERLGVVGANGCGKSTLLDCIAGVRVPTSGKRDVGETTLIGYFTQHPPPVEPYLRVIDYIREVADDRKARAQGLEQGDIPEVRGWPGMAGTGRLFG